MNNMRNVALVRIDCRRSKEGKYAQFRMPNEVTHFPIWRLHSIFVQSTIEPGGLVQFEGIKKKNKKKILLHALEPWIRGYRRHVAGSTVFHLFVFFCFGSIRSSFAVFFFARRTSAYAMRTRRYVHESHIHIMWIIELWWIGNPSSFYLMQLWSERKKCEKLETRSAPNERKQHSGWLSERDREARAITSVCVCVSLNASLFSSLLLHYRLEQMCNEKKAEDCFLFLSHPHPSSPHTQHTQCYLSFSRFSVTFWQPKSIHTSQWLYTWYHTIYKYKSVSPPFIKIKARPKRQQRHQPMRKLYQTKIRESEKKKKKRNKTQTYQQRLYARPHSDSRHAAKESEEQNIPFEIVFVVYWHLVYFNIESGKEEEEEDRAAAVHRTPNESRFRL